MDVFIPRSSQLIGMKFKFLLRFVMIIPYMLVYFSFQKLSRNETIKYIVILIPFVSIQAHVNMYALSKRKFA